MAEQAFKESIVQTLRNAYFNKEGDYISVADGEGDAVHVLIISPQLGGKRAKEKRDLVWGNLIANLKPEEWARISLVAAKTPEEAMAE